MLHESTQSFDPTPASTFADFLGEPSSWGIVIIDCRRSTTWLSVEAESILGLKVDPSKPPQFDALPGPMQTLVCEFARSKRAQSECKFEWSPEGGEKAWLRARVVRSRSAPESVGTVLIVSDLTATRLLERHLQQLNRLAAIGTLSASMAHEIKNALVAGKTFIDLLLEKHEDEELVEIVRRELSRIDSLVSETLRFAKQSKPHFATVRLNDVLAHSLRLIQPQLETRLILVEHSFKASPDLVVADDHQLQQAFVNLFLNAAEAMGPHGRLMVTTDNVAPRPEDSAGEPAQLRVSIQDTGSGIAPEALKRLFEPFFTTKASGTGLGLPITWRIIHEHRGTITVDSQVGVGTSFFILLPALPLQG